MPRRYSAPSSLPRDWPTAAAEMLRQLQLLSARLEELDPEATSSIAPQTAEIVTAAAGDTLRMDPPEDGSTVVFPGADPQNRGQTITVHLLSDRGAVTFQPTSGLVNGQLTLSAQFAGLIQLKSDGVGGWNTTRGQADTDPDEAAAAFAPVDGTYHVESPNEILARARVAQSSSAFGLGIDVDYFTAGFVSWRPGAQAAGSWWAQLLGLGAPPRAYLIADSLGDGLAYELDVQALNAPQPYVAQEYTDAAAAAATTHVITMPTQRAPLDRIVIGMRITALNGAVSALDLSGLPDWAYLDGDSTAADGVGSVDCIELIIEADGSNDPGASITLSLGAVSAAMSARVWLVRDSNPDVRGFCRSAGDTTSGATRDVGDLAAPWREANSLWGAFVGNNNASATINAFPAGFADGQGQLSVTISSHNHTIGFCTMQLRAANFDASAWGFSASPRSAAVHWVVAPHATGQIALSASGLADPATFRSNLYDIDAPELANSLSDFAGTGLAIASAVGNGPFPVPVDAAGANSLIPTLTTVHEVICPQTTRGQGLLLIVSVGGTADVTSVADAGAFPRNWQFLGQGVGTSHGLEAWWVAPADMATEVAASTEPISVTLSAAHGIISRVVPVDGHHPTLLPEVTFTLQNGTGATSIDVASVTPDPGDGSAEANYTYLLFLSFATEDSIVSAYPTNYVDTDGVAGGEQVFVASTNGNIDNSLAYCQRSIRGTTEDPGSATYAGSGNGRTVGLIVGLKPGAYAVMNVSATWAEVLANGNNSGPFNPNIDPGQFLGFGVEADVAAIGGQIRADTTGLIVRSLGSINLDSAGANLDLTSTQGAFENNAGNLLIRTQTPGGGGVFITAFNGSITLGAPASNLVNIESGSAMLRFEEKASSAVAIPAGFGAIWVQNTAPSRLMYTDDTDADRIVIHDGLTNIVTLAMLANLAAGTQIGRQIDAGTGVPVPLTGAEQGENIRFATLQTIVAGGAVALNDDATGLLCDFSGTITNITGTNLDGRTIMVRVGNGFSVDLTHLAGGASEIACPGSATYTLGSREAVFVRNEVAIWRVVDKVPSAGGGGSATLTDATLTLPYEGKHSDTDVVVDAAINPGSLIVVMWGVATDGAENSPEMDDVTFTVQAGSGDMTVRVSSDKSPVGGVYEIRYLIGA